MTPVWDQTALRHEKWKSRITTLNDLECPIIVWTQSYTFVTESYGSGKVGQSLPTVGASRNIRETQPILFSRMTIVTMSWQILLYRIKIVTMSCVVIVLWIGTLSWWTGMIWRNFSLPIESRFCRMRTVFAESAVGTDSVVFYHAEDTNRIRFGLRTGESGRIRLETAESGRFLNNIGLLSWLFFCLLQICEFPAPHHTIWIRLLTNLNREWSYQGRQ